MNIRDYIGEGTEYDKKEALEAKRPKSWLKSVSAFANGKGGVLLFGVSDDDIPVGLKDAEGDAEIISETVKTRMDPVPDIGLSIRREIVDGEYRKFIVLHVYSGEETPYYYTGEGLHTAFIRIGNESVQAQAIDLKRLVLRGSHRTWDSLSSSYEASKFAFGRLHSAYLKRTGRRLQDKDFASFGLMDEKGYLTNAGVLLADDSPVRQSRIFCTRWQGLDKASHLLDAEGDREIEGSVIAQFLEGLEFIRRFNPKKWKKQSSGRVELWDYPERAIEECLVNAIVHRDYLELGSEVHIDVFDDRIEITSPGGMVSRKEIQKLDLMSIPSQRRNPIVADVFGRMDYMERRGSGFRKIYLEYHNSINFREDRLPKFYSQLDYFRATLFNLNYGVSLEEQIVVMAGQTGKEIGVTTKGIDGTAKETDGTTKETDGTTKETDGTTRETDGTTKETRDMIKEAIKENPFITVKELAKITALTVDGVRYHINKMRQEGTLVHHGSTKAGQWVLLNE